MTNPLQDSAIPDLTPTITATPTTLVDALNQAWNERNSSPEPIVIGMADGTYRNPAPNGSTSGMRVLLYGADSPLGVTFEPDDKKEDAFRVWNTTQLGLANARVDAKGIATYSLVVGGTYKSSRAGYVESFYARHIEVCNAKQETLVVAESSADVNFGGLWVHHSGLECSMERPYGEAVYIGKGGNTGDQPKEVVIADFLIEDVNYGEAIDVKLGAQQVSILRGLIRRARPATGGAITLGADKKLATWLSRHLVDQVHIEDIFRSKYSATAIQVGTDADLTNISMNRIQGDGLQIIKQFNGPDNVVRASNVTVGHVDRHSISVNLSAPNGGNLPGELVLTGDNYTLDGAHGTKQGQGPKYGPAGNSEPVPTPEGPGWVPDPPQPPALPHWVEVTLQGSTGEEEAEVVVNGLVAAPTGTVPQSPVTLRVPLDQPATSVRVRFINDQREPTDRNLKVISIATDDIPLIESTHPLVISDASYQPGVNWRLPTSNTNRPADWRNHGWLHTNGSLTFDRALEFERSSLGVTVEPPELPVPPVDPTPTPDPEPDLEPTREDYVRAALKVAEGMGTIEGGVWVLTEAVRRLTR